MSDDELAPPPTPSLRERMRRDMRRRYGKIRTWLDRWVRPICPECHGDGVQVHPMDSMERSRIRGKHWHIYPHRVRVRECPTCDGTGRVRRYGKPKS